MDIFKLIFEHDILLEHLAGTEDPRHTAKKELDLEAFLKPVPTYTKYYLTGSRVAENRFGLSVLHHFPEICDTLAKMFSDRTIHYSGNIIAADNFSELLQSLQPNEHLLISQPGNNESIPTEELTIDAQSNVRDVLPAVTRYMDAGHIILYAEQAHHGVDFHLFSAKNLYEQFFVAFQPMASPDFRYFSINGKKVGSERTFYFETWTLHRPPHGFEEVTSASRLR